MNVIIKRPPPSVTSCEDSAASTAGRRSMRRIHRVYEFVTEFREQTLEPVNRASGFDAHEHRSLQIPVEGEGFAALVVQSPFDEQLASLPWPRQSAGSVCENRNL
jgi:hypothetical protein